MAVEPKPVRPASVLPSRRRPASGGGAVKVVPAPATPVARPGSPRNGGDALFVLFAAATLAMVVAVVVVGEVGEWWVLLPVMAVDFAITIGVLLAISRRLADAGDRGEP